MIKQSNRLNSVEEYYFSKKLREVSKMIGVWGLCYKYGCG